MKTTLCTCRCCLDPVGHCQPLPALPRSNIQASRDKIAEACERLGSNGQGWGLNGDFGVYGCRNLSNGNTIKCTADGRCTDFAGDFRWKTMRKYFDGVDIHTIPLRRV